MYRPGSAGSVGCGLVARLCVCAFVGRDGCEGWLFVCVIRVSVCPVCPLRVPAPLEVSLTLFYEKMNQGLLA